MSSDDEGVRRPGRTGNGPESPAHSNAIDSGAENYTGGNAMDDDDDADLFGSDGDGGLDDIKYAYQSNTECAGY
jgi:RNA polymerase-associated protein LEO1